MKCILLMALACKQALRPSALSSTHLTSTSCGGVSASKEPEPTPKALHGCSMQWLVTISGQDAPLLLALTLTSQRMKEGWVQSGSPGPSPSRSPARSAARG